MKKLIAVLFFVSFASCGRQDGTKTVPQDLTCTAVPIIVYGKSVGVVIACEDGSSTTVLNNKDGTVGTFTIKSACIYAY